jgi:hypothetical protein
MQLKLFEKSYISIFPKLNLGVTKLVLSDFSYGELIVYRNDTPFYYLNIFARKYIRLKKYIEENNRNLDDVLNEIIHSIDDLTISGLHLEKKIWGIEMLKNEKVILVEIDEFPIKYIENYLNHRTQNI